MAGGSGGSAPPPACDAGVCAAQLNFSVILQDPDSYNFCLVPNGGADAVFFAGVAVLVICLASPKWDALIVLFWGAVYQALVYSYPSTFGHVTNASSLWLGMRPADIFVYVFLPPFLVDLAVRIDYFMLKKMLIGILYMAFVMVISSTMIMIPFCLWALGLEANGWTGVDVALFGATIASTDAASVSAILGAGGAPEILSVILEGESLFNDASSLTLFEIFTELVHGHHAMTLGQQIEEIVTKTLWAAFTGVCIGLAMGIFNRIIFAWLQHRNMHPKAEVAFTVAGGYLAFYITQVWCKGSGCIGAVAYGLYGSATLLWGMSNKARYTAIFSQFWDVFSFIINGLIFFYVGASCVNFTVRAGDDLYDHGISELLKDTLYRLPLIWLFSFALRGVFLYVGFKLFAFLKLIDSMGTREIVFITAGGLRGSLSLVLASAVASQGTGDLSATQRRVRAEMSIYIAGYVILTLIVNAPLCGPLMTLLKLDAITDEQLAMRKHIKELFRHYGGQSLGELQLQQDEDDMLQGVDWMLVEEQTDMNQKLDKALPETQPSLNLLGWLSWFRRKPRPAKESLSTLSKASRATVGEEDEKAKEKREAREKEKNIEKDLKRSTVGMAKLGLGSERPLGTTSLMGSSYADPNQEPSMLILGVDRPEPAKSEALDRDLSRKQSNESGPALRSKLSPFLSFFSRGRAAAQGPGPGPHATQSLPAALPSPGALAKSPTLSRALGASMMHGASAGMSALAQPRPAAARPSMVRSRSIALQRQTSMRPPGSAPVVPPAPPVPPPPAPPPMDAEGYAGDEGIMEAISDATRVLTPANAGTPDDVQLPLPADQVATSGANTASGANAASSSGSAATAAAAATGEGSEGLEEERHYKAKHVNPVLVIKAQGSKPQQPLAMTGQGETSELAQMSSAGVRFVQRQSRVDGGQFVEAIHTGKADPRIATSASKGLSTFSRPLGRGSVGNQTRQGSAAGGLSTTAIAALTAAAPGAGADRRQLFESPPGHEFDGFSYAGQGQSASGAAPKAERSLATRSTAIPGAGRWGAGGDRALGRGSYGIGGGTSSKPLGRGSVGQVYSTAPRPEGFPFESPPGHEGDGLAAHALHEGPGGKHGLATRSTGFPGFGPILEAQEAGMQRPMARRSNGHAAGAGAGGPGGPRPVFESPPGHEMDGCTPDAYPSPHPAAGRSYENPLHTMSGGHPVASPSRFEAAAYKGPGVDRPLASHAVGGTGGRKTSTAGRSLASNSLGGAAALGTVNEQELFEPCVGDEEQGGAGPQRAGSSGLKVSSGGGAAQGQQQPRSGLAKLLGGIGSKLGLKQSSSSPDLVAVAEGGKAAAVAAAAGADANATNGAIATTSTGSLARGREEEAGGRTPARASPFARADVESSGPADGGRKLVATSGDGDGADARGDEEDYADGAPPGGDDAAAFTRQHQQEHAAHFMLPECRMRLLMGLKQYYKEKYEASVLGAQAYKTLSFCCESAHHHPHHPMDLWNRVQKEVGGSFLAHEVRAYYYLKSVESRWKAKSKHGWYQVLITCLVGPWIWLLSAHLNNVMMVSLETAVELWISLTDSVQTQWLGFTGAVGEMVLEEVNDAAQKAWDFIIDRRVEIPETFQAIQTHRATVQLLSQQRAFVHQMSSGGLFEDRESVRMLDVVERRLERVRRRGPQWRAQTVSQILANTALLRNVSPKVIEWIKRNSTIRMYKQGELIWHRRSGSAHGYAAGSATDSFSAEDLPGVFVVISGVAKIMFRMDSGDVPMHLGSGSLCGLLSTVLESEAPGMTMTALYAEGHALGEGPVVLHMPIKLVNIIRHFSREERLVTYQQLELQMLRTAANNVIDLLHQQVMSHLGAFIRGAMQHIVCTGTRGAGMMVRRQRLRALLSEHDTDLDSGIDWISELLAMKPGPAHALLEHGEELPVEALHEDLSAEVWHEQMFKAIAAANTGVYDLIRASVKESCAVVLGPGKVIMQHCTMVLVQGSLQAMVTQDTDASSGASGGGAGGAGASPVRGGSLARNSLGRNSLSRHSNNSSNEGHHNGAPLPSQAIRRAHTIISRNDDHVAPSVMVWTPDFFGEEVVKQAPIRIQAGERGATLIVLGDITPLMRQRTEKAL